MVDDCHLETPWLTSRAWTRIPAMLEALRAYILELGKIVIEGDSAGLSMDPRVHAAYLGGKECHEI